MHIKRIISFFCAAIMAATAIAVPFPCEYLSFGTIAQAAEDESVVSRAEWLSSLVGELNKDVTAYPDNYFSDLTEDNIYYNDIMTAVGLGLINSEAGSAFTPNAPATRDFAVHSMNNGLGFIKESDQYSFSDSADVIHKDDAQVSVEQGWLSLESSKFLPEKSITRTEMNNMLQAISAFEKPVPGGASTYKFADGVVEIPNGTDVEITFSGDDEIVSIVNSPKKIAVGNVFVVYYNEYPCIYKAKNVSETNGVTKIVTEETDKLAAIESMDMQSVATVDIDQFEGVAGAQTYYIETEEQARTMSMERGIKVNKDSVIVDYDCKITAGVVFSLSANISNLQTYSWGSISKHVMGKDCGVELSGDITLTGKVKGDLLSVMNAPKNVTLGSVRVAGVGKIALELGFKLNASGEVTYSGGFYVGMQSSGGKTQILKNFYQTGFNSAIEAEADVCLTLKASIDVIVFKGTVAGGTVTGLDDGVELHLYGDINGDGKVNIVDVARANAHAKNTKTLEDYDFSVCDVSGDGNVNIVDVARMNAHVKNTKSLW